MKFFLPGLISLLATAALAQTNSEPAKGTGERGPDLPKIDGVPPGGCMPIGLTARGDLVFPMQCRELLERQRGPLSEEQRPALEQPSQSAPAVKQQKVVAPEQPRVRAPNKKISSVKQRNKQPAPLQVDPDITGSTGKE